MPKIVFIILHYLTYKDTVECVQSIKSNVIYDNYEIVIVDNNSNNGSYENLVKTYNQDVKINLIKNEKNLGFAKGNNIGYVFAKNELGANYIIAINNDTLIEDKEFLNKIIQSFKKEQYYILGPDILSLQDGGHQNPLRKVLNSKKELVKKIIRLNVLLVLNYIKLEKLTKKLREAKSKEYIRDEEKRLKQLDEKQINVPLHGACIIFSPLFIKKFNYAFYPETFLYLEEDILFYICTKLKLKTIYNPQIKIYHKEDSSTNIFLGNNSSKKEKFILKNMIHSSLEFYKLIIKFNI